MNQPPIHSQPRSFIPPSHTNQVSPSFPQPFSKAGPQPNFVNQPSPLDRTLPKHYSNSSKPIQPMPTEKKKVDINLNINVSKDGNVFTNASQVPIQNTSEIPQNHMFQGPIRRINGPQQIPMRMPLWNRGVQPVPQMNGKSKNLK